METVFKDDEMDRMTISKHRGNDQEDTILAQRIRRYSRPTACILVSNEIAISTRV